MCGATRDIADTMPWRCPAAGGDRRHVLHAVVAAGRSAPSGDPDTFVAHDRDLAWAAHAAAHGVGDDERRELVAELADAVRRETGVGFHPTPFARDDALSDELGFAATGGVWVKDETVAVAGSQKVRHLVPILLHIVVAETRGLVDGGRPLAIASCGNAALAAATLARAAGRRLDVFVPTWMDDPTGDRLEALGARVHRCVRQPDDPPGDPAMHRFREAVAAGAVPFTVQGTENALCLDGGRTIGWEIGEQFLAEQAGVDARPPDRVFVQVGGGAFATCLGAGLHDVCGPVPLHAVQVSGCAPLARAWHRSGQPPTVAAGTRDVDVGDVADRWDELMTAWTSPRSVADGILDDETYDWLGVFVAMRRGGGGPVVVPEPMVVAAHHLARRVGHRVSATGSAGLAGLLAVRESVADDERIVVVMSGVAR